MASNPEIQSVLKKLLQCCDTVQGWGTWQDVPFSAANFTVFDSPGATWTVTATNVKTLRYQVVHNTMTVALEIIQASVSGPVPGLLITLPLPAFRCVSRPVGTPAPGLVDSGLLFTNTCMIRSDLSDHRVGTVSLVNDPTGALVLLLQLPNDENINVFGEGGVIGQITFEVAHV